MTGHPRGAPRPGLVALAVLAALAAVGCPIREDDMGEHPCPGPCLDIEPRHHDFGEVPAGSEVVRGWTLTAVGSEAVTVGDLWLDGPGSLALDDALLRTPLAPGEEAWFRVTYAPPSEEVLDATIHVASDDPFEPDVAIPLVGRGIAPVIELTPTGWDAGDPHLGCDQATSVQIRNVGSAPLTLQGVGLVSTSSDLAVEVPFDDGTVLPPLAVESLSLFYRPRDEEPDEGLLTVYSDDPVTPEASVVLSGTAHSAGEVEDAFVVQGEAQADLLFVVDNTETMEWYQAGLGQSIEKLVDALAPTGVDARAAVITTDDGVLVGPVLDVAAPDFAESFAAQAQVGLLGDPWERGLLYARDAVTAPLTDPGGPNEGLLRDTASLHVLVVSDTDDHATDDVLDLVETIAAAKPAPDFLTVHGMTGQWAGCSWWYADADPADRYETAIDATGGASASICDLDWEAWFEAIVWPPPHVDGVFPLSDEPVPETLEIEVDGAPASGGWSLDPYTPAVVFAPDAIPGLGAQVVVRYVRQGEC